METKFADFIQLKEAYSDEDRLQDKIDKAYQLGKEAYAANKERVPYDDIICNALTFGLKISSGISEIYDSWLKGWDDMEAKSA